MSKRKVGAGSLRVFLVGVTPFVGWPDRTIATRWHGVRCRWEPRRSSETGRVRAAETRLAALPEGLRLQPAHPWSPGRLDSTSGGTAWPGEHAQPAGSLGIMPPS